MSTISTARRPDTPPSGADLAGDGHTPPGVADHSGPALAGLGVADLDLVLTAVRHNAVALCEEAGRPPTRLRVTAGPLTVEVSWSDGGSAGTAGYGWDEPTTNGVDQAAANGWSRRGVPAPRRDLAPAGAATGRGAAPGAATATGAAADDDRQAGREAGGPPAAGQIEVTSPSVGVFYHAPEPGARPFVRVGDTVKAGQQLAILEVMKLMIPIEASQSGRIVEVCRPDGGGVEFGDRLFLLAPVAAA
ncbi:MULTISPECIES: acetyl-CoA carboxylase biotin carboxyl carrier protein subunit [unclassified Pseudofrankia]|uniref:acetyl-CoA carboxylase biotin carboxyl carrier protein n=1 Tax=unclassified Pseudofrankia TaxID=2994372 RepID=UPI000B07AA96|nr:MULTISPECIES: acetyl-CoA carboxylase biotin carboxyl carrier protein subunit [unclassified Pseudofrankia]MDT3439070.1 acetyl-CoA carboxylase biotin carboxyl carrier protein subunit [Pseudofrankia sp. BMG5.37]